MTENEVLTFKPSPKSLYKHIPGIIILAVMFLALLYMIVTMDWVHKLMGLVMLSPFALIIPGLFHRDPVEHIEIGPKSLKVVYRRKPPFIFEMDHCYVQAALSRAGPRLTFISPERRFVVSADHYERPDQLSPILDRWVDVIKQRVGTPISDTSAAAAIEQQMIKTRRYANLSALGFLLLPVIFGLLFQTQHKYHDAAYMYGLAMFCLIIGGPLWLIRKKQYAKSQCQSQKGE